MYNNGAQAYRKTNVITADPKRLVIMCYEEAIDNLKIGKQRISQKDYEGKCRAFIKAQDIVNELLCSIDFEKGGSIAKNLESLYIYMQKRIMHADLNKDIRAVDEVIEMLNELKSAWEEAFYKQGNNNIQSEEAGFNGKMRQALGYINV